MRTSGARSLPTVSDGQRWHFSSNRSQRKAPSRPCSTDGWRTA